MDRFVLEFEKPIVALEEQIDQLRQLASTPALTTEIRELEARANSLRTEIFADLSPWQKVSLSRHPARPYTLDYAERLLDGFVELHGDRAFADDHSIVTGLGKLKAAKPPFSLAIIGHQKGRTTKDNLWRNFGMPRPEGYRKALRIMELAARFGRPILTLIDTPGAYPGIGAEERGQAEAIARNLEVMARLPVPIVAVVIGEGGSGGALAVGVADRVLMLEHATYSVISPEGCASILWRDQARGPTAAAAMRIDAASIASLGVADEIIAEPGGGAHRDPERAAELLSDIVVRHFAELRRLSTEDLLQQRYDKFSRIGAMTSPAKPGSH